MHLISTIIIYTFTVENLTNLRIMKKITISFLLLIAIIFTAFAEKVEVDEATKVAKNFLLQSKRFGGQDGVTLVQSFVVSTPSQFIPGEFENTPLLYIFNIANDGGLILVSGDDVASPVLGYTLSGNYDEENLPYSFRKWIEGYKNHIMWAIENEVEAIDEVENLWSQLLKGEYELDNDKRLDPLCSTTWDQSPYYNALCPGGSVTGCVATAMAQVMKYWNHPAQGTGMHSYNHETYGTLSANFGATTYEWSQMPNSISSNNNALATLMYHCGVSVDMNYSPEVSGAWVVEDDSPVCSESAFKNYFGYSSSLHGEKRDWHSNSQWLQMLYTDLDAGRPLVYAGFGSGGGHAFVCDGYDAGDYFHFNWGWGGYYDGFFHIDALDPGGTGTGGGSGGYNSGHQAIFDMVPEQTSSNYDLNLYSNLLVSPSTISMGGSFSAEVAIGNFGTADFSGDFAAWVFDNSGNAIEYVDVISTTLSSGYYNTYTFSTSGMSALLPGNYTISVYYRSGGGNWIKVGDGSYNNNADLYVENDSDDISLYSSFNLSTGGTTLTAGSSFSVTVDIVNYGTSTFYGEFNISLYDIEGYWIETIETLSGAALQSGYYYDDLVFETSGVGVQPGTYLLALQHKPDFGDWTLSGGSSQYPNPIEVIVQTAGEQADVYEPNDTESSARMLPVTFVGNSASVYTTGSNSDNGFDYDYYSINLPSGYDYTITARAHDSYNSGNGQTYTNDILWSYKSDLYWSMAYDDIMYGVINVYNGGTVSFLAAPYFLGETGTYLLDFQITRAPIGVDEFGIDTEFSLYPNPTTDILNISAIGESEISALSVQDIAGNIIIDKDSPVLEGNTYSLDVSTFETGTYIVTLYTKDNIVHRKFVKTR